MFFVRNVRGLNSNTRHNMVKEWIRNHKPLFGACLETHIQPSNSSRIINALPFGWKFFENSEQHGTAMIVVMWHPSVTVTVYASSPQIVTCGIFILGENITLTVSFLYGFNLAEDRVRLWDELASLNGSTPVSTHPWAVLGDFNQILRVEQHSHHPYLEVDSSGIEDFSSALHEAGLFKAPSKGLPFTWWNNQDDNPVSKKIDHALFTHAWAQTFPDAYCKFLEPDQSDHAPCFVSMPNVQRRMVKPFKFFHHIIDHPKYLDAVKEAWQYGNIQDSLQFKLVRSLKLLKPVLRTLNKTHFSGISIRVKEQTEKVHEIQRQLLTSPNPDLARREHEERAKWKTLQKAEEKFYRQKSRVRWHCLGDRDTPYYHKTVV